MLAPSGLKPPPRFDDRQHLYPKELPIRAGVDGTLFQEIIGNLATAIKLSKILRESVKL